MRENRPYGLEGGGTDTNRFSLPLSKFAAPRQWHPAKYEWLNEKARFHLLKYHEYLNSRFPGQSYASFLE